MLSSIRVVWETQKCSLDTFDSMIFLSLKLAIVFLFGWGNAGLFLQATSSTYSSSKSVFLQ